MDCAIFVHWMILEKQGGAMAKMNGTGMPEEKAGAARTWARTGLTSQAIIATGKSQTPGESAA
jgi:hypothetical protein